MMSYKATVCSLPKIMEIKDPEDWRKASVEQEAREMI